MDLKKDFEDKKASPIANFESVEEFTKAGLAEVIKATKSVNAFPTGTSRDLYCAYPTFGKIIDKSSDRILSIINKVLKLQNIKGNIQRRQPDEQFEMILECNDIMLEKLNSNLDELAGLKKNPQTIVVETKMNAYAASSNSAGSWNIKQPINNGLSARLITARNIARPQIKFKNPVDNASSSPFIPKLKEKPNFRKPLAILPEYDENGTIVSYTHPYEFELLNFTVPKDQLKRKTPTLPVGLDETPLVYVDSLSKLGSAIDELKKYPEIAVDVEHHSYRTFQGITCLVQVSTRDKDYIFDTLELRDEIHSLNEVFTNPKIVKILHGADLDVQWLQRDLSLYIVNMFDTHQASKALNMARLSLSFLLKHYCEIEVDKTYQLADWRIRPLPKELIDYARQDTHYLIYIYERLTNDLLDASNGQTNILEASYQRSTEICKKRYLKPIVTDESHLEIFRKSKRNFDNRQLFALRHIFQWRDSIARLEDESYGYVLPNHMMLQISESLPREMQGILACCNPIPPLVRQHLHTLHQIILKARDQPLVKPILENDSINRTFVSGTKDYNSKLFCPHDLSHSEEFRDDLPTLLNSNNISKQKQFTDDNVLSEPKLKVFIDTEDNEESVEAKEKLERLRKVKFVSPYQRYLVALPMIEQEKKEEAARIEAENRMKQLCPIVVKENPIEIIEKPKEDDMYSIPIKEYLKRKYEESVTKKAVANDTKIQNNESYDGPPIAKKRKNENVQTENKIEKQNVEEQSNSVHSTPASSIDHEKKQKKEKKRQKRKNRNKTKNNQRYNRTEQRSDKPVGNNFDYKNVDFSKFKSKLTQRSTALDIQHPFQNNKSNKANNKKFNKLFTFSNVKNNNKK